jgi:glycosyltransferase involved in cell wall biosynthesis
MRRVLLVHHFFHPDDVVSARLYGDLAAALHDRGWSVTVLTSDRVRSLPSQRLPATEVVGDVLVERVHRPALRQSSPVQRLANSAWLIVAWALRAARLEPFDAVVVGSDPAFGAVLCGPLRRLWPRAAIVHWCHDVYPEAIEADGAGAAARALTPLARTWMAASYRRCDAVVDLGPEMRARLERYETGAVHETIPPWALAEPPDAPRPPDPRIRARMFGDATLGLLYSGALGRPHDLGALLDLARACRARLGNRVTFCFSVRGPRLDELRSAVRPDDANVRVAPFSEESELAVHLEAADVHLLSLRASWSGLSVPSKFFGALAVGRPVVYAGPPESDVARWIRSLSVGYELRPETRAAVVDALDELARSPAARQALKENAKRAYDAHFGSGRAADAWDRLLAELVRRRG